jgi:hypothetical protein
VWLSSIATRALSRIDKIFVLAGITVLELGGRDGGAGGLRKKSCNNLIESENQIEWVFVFLEN